MHAYMHAVVVHRDGRAVLDTLDRVSKFAVPATTLLDPANNKGASGAR
jgi:hypothetical protein